VICINAKNYFVFANMRKTQPFTGEKSWNIPWPAKKKFDQPFSCTFFWAVVIPELATINPYLCRHKGLAKSSWWFK